MGHLSKVFLVKESHVFHEIDDESQEQMPGGSDDPGSIELEAATEALKAAVKSPSPDGSMGMVGLGLGHVARWLDSLQQEEAAEHIRQAAAAFSKNVTDDSTEPEMPPTPEPPPEMPEEEPPLANIDDE